MQCNCVLNSIIIMKAIKLMFSIRPLGALVCTIGDTSPWQSITFKYLAKSQTHTSHSTTYIFFGQFVYKVHIYL